MEVNSNICPSRSIDVNDSDLNESSRQEREDSSDCCLLWNGNGASEGLDLAVGVLEARKRTLQDIRIVNKVRESKRDCEIMLRCLNFYLNRRTGDLQPEESVKSRTRTCSRGLILFLHFPKCLYFSKHRSEI